MFNCFDTAFVIINYSKNWGAGDSLYLAEWDIFLKNLQIWFFN